MIKRFLGIGVKGASEVKEINLEIADIKKVISNGSKKLNHRLTDVQRSLDALSVSENS